MVAGVLCCSSGLRGRMDAAMSVTGGRAQCMPVDESITSSTAQTLLA